VVAVASTLLAAVTGAIAYVRLMRTAADALLELLPDDPRAARIIARAMPWVVNLMQVDELEELLRNAREQARERAKRVAEEPKGDTARRRREQASEPLAPAPLWACPLGRLLLFEVRLGVDSRV
jgi:uncharacterized membrane protein